MDVERPAVEDGRRRARTSVGPTVVGLSRCPFCHDAIGLETTEWVACQRCLARHHDGCWDEASGCAACGATRALAKHQPARRRSFAVPAALLLGAVVGLAAGAFAGLRARAVARADTTPAPVVAPVVPVARPVHVPDHVWERLAFLVNEGRYADVERLIDQQLREHPEVATELREVLWRGADGAAQDSETRRRLVASRGMSCLEPIDLSDVGR